ncbi:ERF superfamily protein [Clostridium cavendishii DSM 21758]|uniref:ERF superfamily protein n=1 Tax=Clostridium cavendishii DSM 21758 TaxID=1121302 RepID=A0A1M6K3D1_9CLOT|nr:ERF family protein [Clostridium cavendishii]SHJ53415.1 ERF superfamily protein [Clostridium cavendishii DSM 21758]
MLEFDEKIKGLNLFEKIANISSEIDYLQKDDKVGFGNNAYKAISSEKVIGVCAEKMNKYGIVIIPVDQVYKRTDELVSVDNEGKSKYNRISDVDVKYEVINIHNTTQKIVTIASGTGVDTQDKGVGKAQTYAYKNMLVKLFAIPTGDDTDKVHSDDYNKKLYGDTKKETTISKPNNQHLQTHKCSKCGVDVNENVAKFSNAKYKKVLCINCQKAEK